MYAIDIKTPHKVKTEVKTPKTKVKTPKTKVKTPRTRLRTPKIYSPKSFTIDIKDEPRSEKKM